MFNTLEQKYGKWIVLLDQMVYSGNGFLLTIILAKLLNVNEFGIFSSIILVSYLTISFVSALVLQPFQVNISKHENIQEYISFTWWLILKLIFVITTVSWVLFELDLLNAYYHYKYPIVLFSSLLLFQDYFRKIFLSLQKTIYALIIDSFAVAFQIFCLGYLYINQSFDLKNVFISLGFSFIVPLIFSIVILKPKLIKSSSYKGFAQLHLNEGLWLVLVAFLQWCSSNFFVMVSGVFIGMHALGALRLVQSIFGVLNMLLQTFENYVLPSFSKLYHVSELKASRYLKNITIKAGALFTLVLLVLFVFADSIILLVGDQKYADYSFVIRWMSILYLIIYLGYPVRMYIRVLSLNKYFFIGYLLSFTFSVLSFSFLLKNYELTGAVIGLIINQILMIFFWQYQLVLKNKQPWKLFI
ncbi:MAG: hypothetical protein U0V72_01995 [Cytophagales bacterium]